MVALFLPNPTTHYFSSRIPNKQYTNGAKRPNVKVFVRVPRCAADVSVGGGGSYNYGNSVKFPRMNVWDPFKRLGITPDASEEEIWGARNFLLQQYAGHERSTESIEDAFENLFMASYRRRKKSKINLKSKLRNKIEDSPSWVKRLLDFFELPTIDIVFRRLFLFAFMAAWSIMNSAEAGPAFQVALSLGSCIYFLNEKMKDIKRASILGFGALVVGWLAGSIVVPMIPSALLRPTWTLELLTSLFCFASLFLSCTYLK